MPAAAPRHPTHRPNAVIAVLAARGIVPVVVGRVLQGFRVVMAIATAAALTALLLVSFLPRARP
jgi:hypothetical protein